MLPGKHLLFGFLFSLLLLILFPKITFLEISIFFVSNLIIDVDHYLYYLFKKRDFSLRGAYVWHVNIGQKTISLPRKTQRKMYSSFCFFHGIEIPLILFISSESINPYLYFVFVGVLFHLVLDLFHGFLTHKPRIDRISVIYGWFKLKKLKNIEDL